MAALLSSRVIVSGIRTFDTAQLYQNGGSEERYGKYLTPKYREHVQIFTKTMAEDAATARSHLEGSLRRMKTDYLDLWQLHDMRTIDKADIRVRGVLDVMLKGAQVARTPHLHVQRPVQPALAAAGQRLGRHGRLAAAQTG